MVKPGALLWDIMRAAHSEGMFPLFQASEMEAHIDRRKALRRNPGGAVEQYLADGLWLKISEHRTTDGGTASVYTDITEVKRREAELASKTAMLKSLSSKLAKYLPPQIYKSIFAGEQDVEIAPKRKKLTVFFSDIAGFTDAVEALQSEELTHLLNQYLTEMSQNRAGVWCNGGQIHWRCNSGFLRRSGITWCKRGCNRLRTDGHSHAASNAGVGGDMARQRS